MIAVIDYKAGNAPSVYHAATSLGYDTVLAKNAQDIAKATHIILPGVGSAKATMDSLEEMGIMDELCRSVHSRKALFLGICVGMQVLFERSEEGGESCLGWLKGHVVRYDAAQVRVPQMGWNKVSFTENKPINAQEDYFYFVNSYYAKPADSSDLWGIANYNDPFAAAVCRENIFGTQFHVEKSAEAGLSLLDAFLRLKGGR